MFKKKYLLFPPVLILLLPTAAIAAIIRPFAGAGLSQTILEVFISCFAPGNRTEWARAGGDRNAPVGQGVSGVTEPRGILPLLQAGLRSRQGRGRGEAYAGSGGLA